MTSVAEEIAVTDLPPLDDVPCECRNGYDAEAVPCTAPGERRVRIWCGNCRWTGTCITCAYHLARLEEGIVRHTPCRTRVLVIAYL
jgi:hypothetical protein